jgi:tetratricopeptide (TPR) repeat protein
MEARDILDRKRDFTSKYRATLDKQFAEHYQSSDLPKSREYAVHAVKLFRQQPESDALGGALYVEGLASLNLDNNAEAQTAFVEAIRISKKLKGDPNPDLPRFYAYLGQSEENQFRFSDAERDLRRAFDEAKATSGKADIDTLQTESRMGLFLARTSRARESIPFLADAKDICVKTRGLDDPFYTPMMIFQYGIGLNEFGRPEEALDAVSQAIANRRKNRPGTRFLGYLLEYEAGILIDLGRYDEARALLDESQAISNQVGQKTRPERLAAEMKLAIALDRPQDAIDAIKRYPQLLSEGNGPLSASLFRSLYQRAELALLQKDADAAIQYAARGRQAVMASPQRLYVKRWEVRVSLDETRGYLMKNDPANALPLLQEVVADDAAMLDASSPELAFAQALLGVCYLDLGERQKAQILLAQAKAGQRQHVQLGEHLTQPIRELDARLKRSA